MLVAILALLSSGVHTTPAAPPDTTEPFTDPVPAFELRFAEHAEQLLPAWGAHAGDAACGEDGVICYAIVRYETPPPDVPADVPSYCIVYGLGSPGSDVWGMHTSVDVGSLYDDDLTTATVREMLGIDDAIVEQLVSACLRLDDD